MAESHSHAAESSSYEVHESLKRHPGLDLGLRHACAQYFDAVDFALEFLDEHDPNREGRVSALEIVRIWPDQRETVWRYEHDGSRNGHKDLKEIWGFDVTAWRGPERTEIRA